MERALVIMSKRNMPDVPRRIIKSLQKNGESILNTRTMQQRLNDVSAEQMRDAVDWLQDHHYCREIEIVQEGRNKDGRPCNHDYEVNPAVFER